MLIHSYTTMSTGKDGEAVRGTKRSDRGVWRHPEDTGLLKPGIKHKEASM